MSLLAIAAREVIDRSSILDLGCGPGWVLGESGVTSRADVYGVDLHKPSIEAALIAGYKKVFENEIMTFIKQLPDDSYDMVTAFDLIEHFDKQEGTRLMAEMLRVARGKVLIMTPNGFVEQDADLDNAYQEHKSGWTCSDFRSLGFQKFEGINGYRKLRGSYGRPRIKPTKVGYLICRLSEFFIRGEAERSFQIVAICSKPGFIQR
jgi:SAM-dependent methyltransferase